MVKVAKAAADEAFQTVEAFVQSRRQASTLEKSSKKLQTVVIFRDKNKTEGKKASTFKSLCTYLAILTAIFLVCAVIFTVIIATQWNAMLSDLPAGYVEVGVLLILDAVPAVQGIVWLVRLLKDGGRLKRNDALKIRGKVVGFQYEPYLQKNSFPHYIGGRQAQGASHVQRKYARGANLRFSVFSLNGHSRRCRRGADGMRSKCKCGITV